MPELEEMVTKIHLLCLFKCVTTEVLQRFKKKKASQKRTVSEAFLGHRHF